jgi:superfamily II DNA or RNA helicase
MKQLSYSFIKNEIAKTDVIFTRGENIFSLGNYALVEEDADGGLYSYTFDGSYGDYEVSVRLGEGKPEGKCSCPYPHYGCKHFVAACLDIAQRLKRQGEINSDGPMPRDYLTPEEIKTIALESREERAKKEGFSLHPGDTYKGTHAVTTPRSKEYRVTIYNPLEKSGHCTCPDFATNHLDTCKHLLFTYREFSADKNFPSQAEEEVFPFVHITWNSRLQKPCCYYERIEDPALLETIQGMFNERGMYTRESISRLYSFYAEMTDEAETVCFDEYLLERMEEALYQREIGKLEKKHQFDFSFLRTTLYPYQDEGVRFSVFKKAAIIADEMGLGKTIQAIAVALLKKELFGFTKVLIVSPSSLKSQWKSEIEKFTDASAAIISGTREKRHQMYFESDAFFKITNYEAVLRDILAISRWQPDFVILDEAQRIKNFETKTHKAIQSVPRQHSLVITGTPLENKLEDLYSIVQFSDPTLLTPLWAFAANHFNLSKTKKNKVLGYKNLDTVYEKIQPLLIRRKKKDVLENLPDKIENNYYIDLSAEQEEIHQGYLAGLLYISSKKVLTPMDIKRLQQLLTAMRMVCDSTYLIDKKTNISPKLVELVSIVKELVLENRRKVIIFSEWTTMTYLIGKALSDLGIDFVEFTGKVPVEKRPLLIEEFRNNPDCMVFLSTDAGGVGLNLQNTDCLINFELPWNPARLNQRIGRIHRIGQKSSKINVINLITKNSIEEKVYAGINLKQELFDAALEGKGTEIDMSRENKNKFVNQIRAMFNGEEIDTEITEDQARPELDEQTPHYLNPEVFKEKEAEIDIGGEEFGDTAVADEAAAEGEAAALEVPGPAQTPAPAGRAQPAPEELEAVLNQGMAFLDTLSRMATGKPLTEGGGTGKSVEVDRETGEVVMRFKLPGL